MRKIPYLFAFILLLSPAGLSYASATSVRGDASLSDSLVSFWLLDESSGTRVDIKDANDLTDNNTVTAATGIQSNAGDFTSANSEFVNRTDALGISANSNISLSFWFKLKSNPSSGNYYQFLSYKLGSGSTESAYYLDYHNDLGTYKLRQTDPVVLPE